MSKKHRGTNRCGMLRQGEWSTNRESWQDRVVCISKQTHGIEMGEYNTVSSCSGLIQIQIFINGQNAAPKVYFPQVLFLSTEPGVTGRESEVTPPHR